MESADAARFFESLAESWQGWTGTREWHDTWGQVVLRASSDTTGHTNLVVQLSHADFSLRATLVFEAGQRDESGSFSGDSQAHLG
jgi:uncharacterized protein DUF6228